ncbi:complex I NDUFA9 subunit family protein [Salinarchaeum sp. IM2453]|uniref:complex I NDUFA9 subunit family protein n=1 Tax=Salinarchaeum sp. IM2453 TaxID=2862870 RepID=UPI001C82C6DA|nr:complex I NDUFA9 subunit family protein [Salinarchaeum sp. IM2453]QZA89383.1 complex I NDUFA9 subunit family protein [Salinarchaeum sp. IM2453]
MRILLIGGSGFIGTALATELQGRNHDVTVFSRSPDDAILPEGIETIAGDATDQKAVIDAAENHNVLVNLVALSPLFEPPGDLTHKKVHVGATNSTIKAAEKHNISQIIQLSALGADPHGETAYIQAKGRSEELIKQSSADWTIFRPSIVFGDGGEFIPFIKKVSPGPIKPLPGGGKTRFQPIWVGDLTKMIADAIEESKHKNEIYEIGGPEVLSLAEITKRVAKADGKKATIVPVPMSLANIGLSALDPIPFFPMGADQAKALAKDNITEHNDIDAFGREKEDLLTITEYL